MADFKTNRNIRKRHLFSEEVNEHTVSTPHQPELSRNDKSSEETISTGKSVDRSVDPKGQVRTGTFWLTRIVFFRCLGFIYFIAFLIAFNQNDALIGSNGLLPAELHFKQIESHSNNRLECFFKAPSIFWLLNDWTLLDFYLHATTCVGLIISFAVMFTGTANMIAMFLLWLFYMSIINLGQTWYSFGWESQLLETGFLSIFWCHLFSWKKMLREPTPIVIIWGYRWLLFRIMIGAGLIKIRGDKCWKDLTCMNYHYQTQPVPNPISYYMHQSPEIVHKFETLSNHFIELIVPWFTFLFRKGQIFCGIFQIFFQIMLIISGNLSFLNWLTMLPAICYFDDACMGVFFNDATKKKIINLQKMKLKTGRIKKTVYLILGLTVFYLSIPVVINLFSSRQKMNYTFDPFRIVNTYGAFGSVTKVRSEVILQGTYSADPNDPSASWLEYEFKCKPGNVTRRPCLISPYHYRLDWLAWFAAFQNYQYNPWLIHLAAKLMVNDEKTESLLAYNPFHGKMPPRFIRGEHYKYTYTKIGSKLAKDGNWWKRKRIGSYFPPVSLPGLTHIFKNFEWKTLEDPYTQKS